MILRTNNTSATDFAHLLFYTANDLIKKARAFRSCVLFVRTYNTSLNGGAGFCFLQHSNDAEVG